MSTNNSAAQTASSGGVSIMGILGLIFVLCKIFGVAPIAGWSWWLVTLPFWGGLALVLAVLLLIGIICLIAAMLA